MDDLTPLTKNQYAVGAKLTKTIYYNIYRAIYERPNGSLLQMWPKVTFFGARISRV
jgi:hypothetical protein